MVNVAQLVEHPVVVRTVVGSSPIVHPMKKVLAQASVFCYGVCMKKILNLLWQYILLVLLGISLDIRRNIGTFGTPQQWHPDVWHFLLPFAIVIIPYVLSHKKVQKALGIPRSKAESPIQMLFSSCFSFGFGIILACYFSGILTPWLTLEVSLLSLGMFVLAYLLILHK